MRGSAIQIVRPCTAKRAASPPIRLHCGIRIMRRTKVPTTNATSASTSASARASNLSARSKRALLNKNRQAHQSNSGLQLGHFHPSGYLRGSQVHDGHSGDRDSETHPPTNTFVIATQVAPLDERIWNAGLNKNGDDKTNDQDRSHMPEVGANESRCSSSAKVWEFRACVSVAFASLTFAEAWSITVRRPLA